VFPTRPNTDYPQISQNLFWMPKIWGQPVSHSLARQHGNAEKECECVKTCNTYFEMSPPDSGTRREAIGRSQTNHVCSNSWLNSTEW
jgi:hypothetical protein